MLELLFLMTAGQCVPNHATTHAANVTYENVTTVMHVGDTLEVDADLDKTKIDITHNQFLRNSNCGQEGDPVHMEIVRKGDPIPQVHGSHQRLIDDVYHTYLVKPQDMVIFVEMGTVGANRKSYDLQDFIFVIQDKSNHVAD